MSDETSRTDEEGAANPFGTAPGPSSHEPGSSVHPQNPYTADTSTGPSAGSSTRETPETGRPVAFCQDCGRSLTSSTLRPVGRAVFCEPCLERRLANSSPGSGGVSGSAWAPGSAWTASTAGGSATAPTGTVPDPAAPSFQSGPSSAGSASFPAVPGEPRPVLAAILGLIPGVGAMYNGQFAKGIVHLIIFAILVSLSDDVNGVFGIFVAGWIGYQAFEAYHTAIARRDGLPLPNAFGFNDVGERMGFGVNRGSGVPVPGAGPVAPSSWSAGPAHPASAHPVSANPVWPGPASATPPPGPPGWSRPVAPSATAPGSFASAGVAEPSVGAWGGSAVPPASRDWVGYVPPTAFAQAGARSSVGGPAGFVQSPAQPAPGTGTPYPPYGETFAGGAQPFAGSNPYAPVPATTASPRFPAGAIWLIGLGLLILVANVLPDWRLSERWLPPLLFAGLSVWLFTRRHNSGARLACIIRWPALLMILAILFALHALYFVVTFGTMCAVMLIALGALLMIERTLGASEAVPAPPFGTVPGESFVPSTGFTTAGPAAGTPLVADDRGTDLRDTGSRVAGDPAASRPEGSV